MAEDREFGYDEGGNFNPYYSPEKCGLVLIGEVDRSDECYQFDLLVVWQDNESKKLYCAEDSGCSCPTPFEEVHRLSDMEEIEDPIKFARQAKAWWNNGCTPHNKDDLERLIGTVIFLEVKNEKTW